MAALKENLLSPWHVNETRDTLDSFRRDREEGIRKSENRRMELQGNILNLQRDKHLRAARLQWCLQELREREGKARRHNQQLLQDFHRAQDSLGEMVACTATMNTIRLEYERYLQENSPRWHQQLRENAHASQKKRMDESLKGREEEQVSASPTRDRFSPPRGNSLYRTARTTPCQPPSADTPTCDYSGVLQNTPRPQRAWSVPEDPRRARSTVSPTMPSSSRPSQAHQSHDSLRFHSTTVVPQPGPSQVHRRTSPQQGPPPWGAAWSHWSPAWASSAVAPPPSTAGPSGWGLVPGRGAVGVMAPDAEGWGENRKSGSKCSSQELDIKPVRLSSAHGDSSDGGSDPGSGRSHRGRRKRREEEEGGQRSDSDRKSSSQESAGTSSADSEVKQTTSAAGGRRVTGGQEGGAPSETESNSTSRRGRGKSVQERRAERRTGGDLDHLDLENGPKTQKSKSEVEESSVPMTDDDDEDPADQSEGSRKERGHRKDDSLSVSAKSERGPAAAAAGRVGEKAGEVQEELGETDGDVEPTDEDTGSENEDNAKDEEESWREENEEEEDEGREDGETEGREQPGSSESESGASRSQAEEEQETNGFQTEIEDEAEDEADEEVEEEEVDEGDGGADIEKPGQGSQAGESEEESDSDDGIVSPQEHRSIKKVQSISKEEEQDEADSDKEGEDGEGSGGEHSDDDDDEVDDIERLVAPETHRKQENQPKSLDKTKVIKKDSFEESLPVESNKGVKMAEDTDDEFDHFYD